MKGKEGREKVKKLDMVRNSSRRIERESSEPAYIWDRDDVGKTEIVNDRNSVD